ncbi:hypothetical protein QBC41DRAFT_310951 [Cercophora samala]|uniref:Uncharacterized protein n=1 Tax=Cercophora samala TaxID=330535 RepID=A0AA39ZMR6_9PEZI|nr:hypothetical protein QBC41DRAFT_310951 [Cercophora samala]
MRWHAWKGSPCQRIFFHRAISSSFANRRAMRLGAPPSPRRGVPGEGVAFYHPCRPTSLASPPTSAFSVLYSTTRHARSTELPSTWAMGHGPCLPSLKALLC